jgi:L-ascorbate metabolism protein UlaG (beta-lactamase superfamily)
MTAELTVRLVGGPTTLIELGGVRLLTDPTFDPPGDHPIGTRVLTKTSGPAVPADELGPVDAVLFAGAARTPPVDGYLTLTAADAAEAAAVLGARTVVPVRAEGWAHFTQGVDDLVAAYAARGLADRLRVLSPGETATV